MNVALMIAGIVLCVIGFAMLVKSKSQSGGLSLRNFGINIGGMNIQINQPSTVDHGTDGDKKTETKRDWGKIISLITGLIVAITGLITIIASLFK